MNNLNRIEYFTKLNLSLINQKLRLFSKVDITTKLKIFEKQKKIFYKLKNGYKEEDNSLLALSSLILAIASFEEKINSVNLNAIKLRVKNSKERIKRQKLLNFWAIVKTLKKDQNMSFRDISIYFKKYHKFEVSYSLVYQVWNEIEVKNTKKDN